MLVCLSEQVTSPIVQVFQFILKKKKKLLIIKG